MEKQGRFTVPGTMSEVTEHLSGLASPVSQFIEDHLEVTGNESDLVRRAELYNLWTKWHGDNGTNPGSAETMCKQLNAADARISYGQREIPGGFKRPGTTRAPRDRYVIGVKLI